MPDDSTDSDLALDLGNPTRGDVRKLASWVEQLKAESDPDASPFSTERLRLLLKGRSKTAQQIFRNFDRWLEKRVETAGQQAAEAVATLEEKAPPSDSDPNVLLSARDGIKVDGLGHIHVVLFDLRADPEALARSRAGSAVDWSSFASVSEMAALPTDRDTTYFGLFDQLAGFSPDPESTHTLFLEGGATLNQPVSNSLPADSAVTLLRDEAQPFYQRDQLLRWFAFPQTFGGVLVSNQFLAERASDWARLWHFAPWSWALHQLDEIGQSADAVIDREPHDANLSDIYRNWLQRHRPERIGELREPLAEWGSLLHDLVGAVVAEHPDYFEANAAYLAATAASGVRR